jgi:hypothetical protein
MATMRPRWHRLAGRGTADRSPAPGAPETPGLELADAPEARKPSRVGAAGFDPYSSDAGYAKPHCWERVDHD